MEVNDKVYEAHAWSFGVMFYEYTIKEVCSTGVWIIDKQHKDEQYALFADFELHYSKTKAEAIDKCIKRYKMYIDDYEKRIKMLEEKKEKQR